MAGKPAQEPPLVAPSAGRQHRLAIGLGRERTFQEGAPVNAQGNGRCAECRRMAPQRRTHRPLESKLREGQGAAGAGRKQGRGGGRHHIPVDERCPERGVRMGPDRKGCPEDAEAERAANDRGQARRAAPRDPGPGGGRRLSAETPKTPAAGTRAERTDWAQRPGPQGLATRHDPPRPPRPPRSRRQDRGRTRRRRRWPACRKRTPPPYSAAVPAGLGRAKTKTLRPSLRRVTE